MARLTFTKKDFSKRAFQLKGSENYLEWNKMVMGYIYRNDRGRVLYPLMKNPRLTREARRLLWIRSVQREQVRDLVLASITPKIRHLVKQLDLGGILASLEIYFGAEAQEIRRKKLEDLEAERACCKMCGELKHGTRLCKMLRDILEEEEEVEEENKKDELSQG